MKGTRRRRKQAELEARTLVIVARQLEHERRVLEVEELAKRIASPVPERPMALSFPRPWLDDFETYFGWPGEEEER